MSEKDMILHKILTAAQAGTIVCNIARTLDISPYQALRRFIKSKTYANFRVAGSALSMCGDPAIVDEFLSEIK